MSHQNSARGFVLVRQHLEVHRVLAAYSLDSLSWVVVSSEDGSLHMGSREIRAGKLEDQTAAVPCHLSQRFFCEDDRGVMSLYLEDHGHRGNLGPILEIQREDILTWVREANVVLMSVCLVK